MAILFLPDFYLKLQKHIILYKNNHHIAKCGGYMVELGGIEPPSESTLTRTSPGADGYFGVKPIPSLGRKPSRVPIR